MKRYIFELPLPLPRQVACRKGLWLTPQLRQLRIHDYLHAIVQLALAAMSGPTTNGDYRQEENIASSSRHPASPRSSSTSKPSLDLPALEPFSHDHPLLSQDTFNPDDLLQSRSHVPLEELRGELRSYLTVLREELVQLINEDYEEFISLGVGLRGEVGRLQRLEGPLDELQQEVKVRFSAVRC